MVLLKCVTFLNPAAVGTGFSYFINRNIFALIQRFLSVRFMAAVSGSVAILPPPVFRLFHVRWMDTPVDFSCYILTLNSQIKVKITILFFLIRVLTSSM